METIQVECSSVDSRIKEICEKYWTIDSEGKFIYKTTELISQYNSSIGEIKKIISLFSKAFSENVSCNSCKTPLLLKSRSHYSNSKYRSFECNICNEKKKEDARIAAEKYGIRKVEILKILSSSKIMHLGNISLESAIYLLAITRYGMNEKLTHIKLGCNDIDRSFCPTIDFEMYILKKLCKGKNLLIDPSTPIQNLKLVDDFIFPYYIEDALWTTPDLINYSYSPLLALELERTFAEKTWPKEWQNENDWRIIWKIICIEECVQYLTYMNDKYNIPNILGQKTRATFSLLIDTYSVSQIFSIIRNSVRRTAAEFQRNQLNPKHSANMTTKFILSLADWIKGNNKEAFECYRPPECSQSILSKVFFDSVIQIGFDGFKSSLHTTKFNVNSFLNPEIVEDYVI